MKSSQSLSTEKHHAPSDDDRFGMPNGAFEAALNSHGRDSPVIRAGMYVPTRREVVTLAAATLAAIVIDWMWERPSALIPTNEQIGDLRAILLSRPHADQPGIRQLVAGCDDYSVMQPAAAALFPCVR